MCLIDYTARETIMPRQAGVQFALATRGRDVHSDPEGLHGGPG